MFSDSPDSLYVTLTVTFCINLVTAMLVLRLGKHDNREFKFSAILLNVVTFWICAMLHHGGSTTAVGLGLFGVFSILRYRTQEIAIRELTHLFVLIGIALANGLVGDTKTLGISCAVNISMVVVIGVVERLACRQSLVSVPLLYDNLALVSPGRAADLHADIGNRLGVCVVSVAVHRIDLLRDAAEITVHYSKSSPSSAVPA